MSYKSYMQSKHSEFLQQLLATPSPSGHEIAAQQLWATHMRQYCDEIYCDTYANTWALKQAGDLSAPTIMISAHADEIGVMVRCLQDDGYVRIAAVGGMDAELLCGRSLCFNGKNGLVQGVVAHTAIHMRRGETSKSVQMSDLYVDFGCSSAEELKNLGLYIGCIGVYDNQVVQLAGNNFSARALDNRISGYILARCAQIMHDEQIECSWNVVFLNAVMEEIGTIGARMASYQINPEAAICLDVTHASDAPNIDKAKYGDIKLGAGPVLCRGGANHPLLVDFLENTANHHAIALQHEISPARSGTDTDSIFQTRCGIASALVSVPLRYMHSAVETANHDDVENIARLLVASLSSLKKDQRFSWKLS